MILDIDISRSDGSQIIHYTSNAPQFFGYDLKQFSLIKDIEHLIPSPVKGFHNQLVRDFCQTQKSKYYNQVSEVTLLHKGNYIFLAQMFYHINMVYNERLVAKVFLHAREEGARAICLILNAHAEIVHITRNCGLLFHLPGSLS